MNRKIIYLFVLALLITSYASAQPVKKVNLKSAIAKTKIIKGKTTQNELLKVLGSPDIATMDKDGNEVWAYTSALTIVFDDKDVVKDFTKK